MRSHFVIFIALVATASALPRHDFDARDTGLCGKVGQTCHTKEDACCEEEKGIAFCNGDGDVAKFTRCDVSCHVSGGSSSCIDN